MAALVGSISLAACNTPTAMAVAQDVATSLSIVVNDGTPSESAGLVLEVGDTISLSAVATNPLGMAVPTGAVTWSSSDESVVQIDASGLVTAVGAGGAEVHATAGEASSTLGAVVSDPQAF